MLFRKPSGFLKLLTLASVFGALLGCGSNMDDSSDPSTRSARGNHPAKKNRPKDPTKQEELRGESSCGTEICDYSRQFCMFEMHQVLEISNGKKDRTTIATSCQDFPPGCDNCFCLPRELKIADHNSECSGINNVTFFIHFTKTETIFNGKPLPSN